MKAFLCTNGIITRCDAPGLEGQPIAVAEQFGFALHEADSDDPAERRCAVCRPRHNQDVYLTIHGMERNIYALVIWQQGDSATYIFAPTPFDLVTAVEYVSRYEQALCDLRRVADGRASRPAGQGAAHATNGHPR